jgi:glycerophosphoryl diester phosphodiesterase
VDVDQSLDHGPTLRIAARIARFLSSRYMRLAPLLALLSLASCAGVPPLRDAGTRVIAHRGGTGPDGTIAGCRRTMETGVVFLELDVRLTRDGQAVILHDPTVDRTTDGKGPVDQLTLDEVKRLDAGVKFQKSYAGERIPTVAELLRAVGPRAMVLLELKVPQAAGPVVDAIRAESAFDRAVVRTADEKVLQEIRDREPRALTGTMGPLPPEAELDAFVKKLTSLGVRSLTPKQDERVTASAVRRLQTAGIAVWGTNTNDPEVWRRLLKMGVDGIITDRPDELRVVISTTLDRE